VRYFDTAYILKLYLCEPGSEAVMQAANDSGGLASSALAFSELHGALHRNLRDGSLERGEFETVLERFAADVVLDMWHWLPVTMPIHRRVASVYRELPESVFLRTADAIHLATAVEHGFHHVYSNDRHLLAAAPHFGVAGINVIEDGAPVSRDASRCSPVSLRAGAARPPSRGGAGRPVCLAQ
jgi:predicted nucleic acid-binding protein